MKNLHKFLKFTEILVKKATLSTKTQTLQTTFTQIHKNIYPWSPLITIILIMSRGHVFTDLEIEILLNTLEEALPGSPNDWDEVTRIHCSYYPGRSAKSLKCKFAALYCH